MRTTRALLLALVLAAALLGLPGAAHALEPGAARAFADRIARHWAANQGRTGFFVDPDGRRQRGYGNVMIGYGLLRAGARAGDPALVRAGVRGVSTGLAKPVRRRGVFEMLSLSAAYRFARRNLAANRDFARARPAWEQYLRTIGSPFVGERVKDCKPAHGCFHNHEAVEAAGQLELLATGLTSTISGTRLADRQALLARALQTVGVVEPEFAAGGAFVSGPRPLEGLGLLSDSGPFPLAYHSLSVAMLARSIELLGRDAPPAALDALARAANATTGFMGPDGDVAYLGRRQEQAWALAAAAAGAEIGAKVLQGNPSTARALVAVADRAFARLRRVHGLGPVGVRIVPRGDGAPASGADLRAVTFNGLTVYLLNLAADAAARRRPHRPGALTADRDGAFLDPAQSRLAAVREGAVWYAVHGRRFAPDARNDFGLVALKLRDPDGGWRDLVRPRPLTTGGAETAGPVILRDGLRLLPRGRSMSIRPGGTVVVRGGFAAPDGVTPTRSAVWRFVPLADGASMSFRARTGETVVLTTYLPARRARTDGKSVWDSQSRATTSPPPTRVRWRRGFASCCDASLVAADMIVRPTRAGPVTYSVRSNRVTASDRPEDESDGQPWWPLLGVAAVFGLLLLGARRARGVRRPRR